MMTPNLIGQQESFLKDYRKRMPDETKSDEEILSEVIQYLDREVESTFILETKNHRKIRFPFKKELRARDYDATINTHYVYAGEPFELNTRDDEQQEW